MMPLNNACLYDLLQGMENIMLVLEETVMPMMMDAVVIILGCDHYYQQCSVASGSDQPQFPPGYHPRRAISIGKDCPYQRS